MMIHRIPTLLAAVLLLAATALAAQDEPAQDEPAQESLEVTTAVVATGVQDREPVGADSAFSADVDTVYFYTVLEGEFGERQLEHVWLRDGEEVARVPLTVRGPRFRTWSSKTIPSDGAGSYTVRLVDEDDAELASVDFTVGSGGEGGGGGGSR
jgi:hypothetical protein